ncbi:unnamed protein product [Timema podura]|uniref:Uncharacterized protein n=1 Tax=Timema podura TaxID=61482 RepID=A0ABN7NER5_TIMPD|nr:unnamed protein product [Timema podura]
MPNRSLDCKGDLNSDLNEYDEENEPIYATLSSHSCCSATTAANDDFDFYQHETNDIPKLRKSKINHTTKLDMHSNSFQLDDKYHSTESQVCKDPIESATTAILHKCEILNNETSLSQSCKIDSSSQMCGVCNKYNDLVDIIVPVIQDLHGKNDRDDRMLKQELENTVHESSSFSEEILKTVIERDAVSDRVVPEESIKANTFPKDPLKKSAPLSQSILQKSRPNTSTSGTCIRINANMFVSPQEICRYPRADERKYSRTRKSKGKGFIPTDTREKQVKPTSAKVKQNLFLRSADLSDDNDIVFELPVKSESTLSLYRLHLNDDVNGDNIQSDQVIEQDQNHRFYKQSSVNSRPWGQIMPHSQRMGRQTPPMPRMLKQKKTLPVLSMESLNSALNTTGDSYLDNGDLCHHNRDHCGSVPDFRRACQAHLIIRATLGRHPMVLQLRARETTGR